MLDRFGFIDYIVQGVTFPGGCSIWYRFTNHYF